MQDSPTSAPQPYVLLPSQHRLKPDPDEEEDTKPTPETNGDDDEDGSSGEAWSDDEPDQSDFVPDSDYGQPKKKKSKAKATKATASPKSPKSPSSPSKRKLGGKKGAWTAEQDWAMFQQIHPRRTPDWKAVAAAVGGGRDVTVSLGLVSLLGYGAPLYTMSDAAQAGVCC